MPGLFWLKLQRIFSGLFSLKLRVVPDLLKLRFLFRDIGRLHPVSVLLTVMAMFFLSSCQMFWAPHSPKGYVLPRPELHFLEKKLNEISGLYYLKGEGSMLAIADDKKHIYRVYTEGTINDYWEEEFGGAGDYEDVVKADSSVFVLLSDGIIFEIKHGPAGLVSQSWKWKGAAADVEDEIKEKKKAKDNPAVDFETLYYDSTARGLIMIAKHIKGESKAGIRTAWRFDLATRTFDPKPFFTINIKEVNNALKDGQVEFKPSGAAISPVDHRLYILSSAGHLLVVCNLRGKVQEVYRLNPTFYPQPEGIAFAENGDMYISNEAKLGKASLLRIPYNVQKAAR
jgi:hypothetical protein